MEKFIIGLLSGITIMCIVAVIAVLGGTILFWIWPVAIPAAFPGLVSSSIIAGKIAWWPSVCLVWIFGILIKNSVNNNNK